MKYTSKNELIKLHETEVLGYDRRIDLKELQKLELQLLKQFHFICEKEKFKYSLAGGTLLGAVRHKGFIPWDDDIDVSMPREYYEKFIKYCLNHQTPFNLICSETNNNFKDLYAKISNPNTIIEENETDIEETGIGVHIDIFPIDGLGNTYNEAYINYYRTVFYRELLNAAHWKKYFLSKTHSIIYEPLRVIFFILSRFISTKRIIHSIRQFYKKINFSESKYSACICGVYRSREILPTKLYSEYTNIIFENEAFKCFKDYNTYLISFYGDYMKLPPESKRKTHHLFKAYYK